MGAPSQITHYPLLGKYLPLVAEQSHLVRTPSQHAYIYIILAPVTRRKGTLISAIPTGSSDLGENTPLDLAQQPTLCESSPTCLDLTHQIIP